MTTDQLDYLDIYLEKQELIFLESAILESVILWKIF